MTMMVKKLCGCSFDDCNDGSWEKHSNSLQPIYVLFTRQ